MGVRKLTSYCEDNKGSTWFRKVNIAQLRNVYEREHPGSPVELLMDFECCVSHLLSDSTEPRYGGDMVHMVEVLRNFYEKFNRSGIKVITFFGNYKGKDRRNFWIKKRYDAVQNVMKMINSVRDNRYNAKRTFESGFQLNPSETVDTAAAIIRFVLGETVVHSFTENDMEIITYARMNKSFAILSQDSDFIIANAAKYYLSMKHLNIYDMTTYLYDCPALANHLHLHMNQLPLFATMMGNDLMEYDMMKNFYKKVSVYEKSKSNLDKFVSNIARICSNVQCNEVGMPVCRDDITRRVDLIRGGYYRGPSNLDTLITDSIESYGSYSVETELTVHNMLGNPKLISLALTLYRQRWITCDLLMLICTHEYQMATCIEIFNELNIKPIGDVLAKLRAILYGATFPGFDVEIKEFIITGVKCLDNRKLTTYPLKLNSVQPLDSVWRRSLKPGSRLVSKIDEPMRDCVKVDERVWEKISELNDDMMSYMIKVFSEGCNLHYETVQKLISIIPGLPKSVLVPLYTCLYFNTFQGKEVYQSFEERLSVLLTFSLVSILTPSELEQFIKISPEFALKAEDVNLIRIVNLFMKATQLIINLNAVCGFPIPLDKVDGHNFWQGSVLQHLYAYLHGRRDLTHLVATVRDSLRRMGITHRLRTSQDNNSPLHRFDLLMDAWTQLNLYKTTHSPAVAYHDSKYKHDNWR